MYVQWAPTGSRSRPGVSPVPARLNSRLWHGRSWSVATTAGTSVRNIWYCFAVVWMLPVWQIFPGAVWWINVVQCCYTVLSSWRIGSWAMTVYFTYCQSYRCCQSAPCNSSHVRWRYPVICTSWSRQHSIDHHQIRSLYHGHWSLDVCQLAEAKYWQDWADLDWHEVLSHCAKCKFPVSEARCGCHSTKSTCSSAWSGHLSRSRPWEACFECQCNVLLPSSSNSDTSGVHFPQSATTLVCDFVTSRIDLL